MISRTADPNYQALAAQFRVHDLVVPYGASAEFAGRVVAVFPAIGMVEVQFPHGSKRYAVEDLQRLTEEGHPRGRTDDTVPGGLPTVEVPGGPVAQRVAQHAPPQVDPTRVAQAFVKQALYWAARDRQYRATNDEMHTGSFTCPKCKKSALRKAIYRRMKGKSERLYGCPSCLFLIERDAILGNGV